MNPGHVCFTIIPSLPTTMVKSCFIVNNSHGLTQHHVHVYNGIMMGLFYYRLRSEDQNVIMISYIHKSVQPICFKELNVYSRIQYIIKIN